MKPKELPLAGKLGADICLSGGAPGADVAWGIAAECSGHTAVHWSFKGHKPGTKENIFVLDDDELFEADEYLKEANKFLKRSLPFRKPWIMNLLRRNWYQVKYIDSLYAVGTLNESAVIHEHGTGKYHLNQFDRHSPERKEDYVDHMGVNGGTAWACQMYFGRWLEENKTFDPGQDRYSANPLKWFPPFKMYFYDQEKQLFLIWAAPCRHWVWVGHSAGKPSGVYAAVGTRDLNNYGQAFIEELYNR